MTPAEVDPVLHAFLAEQRVRADLEAAPLFEEVQRLVLAGGKRIRPQFCYWGHLAGGGRPDERIARAAASLELLHTFAIVQDDVMDGSPVRRGAPSTWREMAAGRGDDHGRWTAVLVADLCLVLADRLLAQSGFPAPELARATDRYDRMRVQAIAGQYLDLSGPADEDAARRAARLKSGGYTVTFPLLIGADLACAGSATLDALAAYGDPIGEAFQIRDDVLGVLGDPERTGKDADADLREGKRTVLIVKLLAALPAGERAWLLARLGDRSLQRDDAERVRELVRSSGALDDTGALIESLHAQAMSALGDAKLDAGVDAALRALADRVTVRDA